MSDPVYIHRSAIAVAVRQGDAQAEHTARENFAEAKIARAIQQAINAAPPLTAEARDRLAELLSNGGAK